MKNSFRGPFTQIFLFSFLFQWLPNRNNPAVSSSFHRFSSAPSNMKKIAELEIHIKRWKILINFKTFFFWCKFSLNLLPWAIKVSEKEGEVSIHIARTQSKKHLSIIIIHSNPITSWIEIKNWKSFCRAAKTTAAEETSSIFFHSLASL